MTQEPFTEELRYTYPELTPDSVVLDCGGYEGTFAEGISQRYDCHVVVLEPVRAFYERTRLRLMGRPKVHVHHFGIGRRLDFKFFRIKGDMTGEFADGSEMERVLLVPPWFVQQQSGVDMTDLLKLNIEGGEYDVLSEMLESGTVTRMRNIQVQWHNVDPGAERAREGCIAGLSKTHELTFDHGWVWQNWRLKA